MRSMWRRSDLCVRYETMHYLVQAFIFFSLIIRGIGEIDSKNYGPYHMNFKTFEVCKGPKPTEAGIFLVKDAKNMSHVVLNLEIEREVHPTAGKIAVSSITNNVTKKLYTHAMNKPCEHFVVGPVLYDLLNMTKTCKVAKGNYEMHLDFQARAKIFLGKSFFYGSYLFKITAYTKVNNFFCLSCIIEFTPRT